MRFVRQRQTPSIVRIFILSLSGYIIFLYFFLIVVMNTYEVSNKTVEAIYKADDYLRLQNQLLKVNIANKESLNSSLQRAFRLGFIPISPSQTWYIR